MANEHQLPQYIERTTPADHRFMPSFTLLLPTLFGYIDLPGTVI